MQEYKYDGKYRDSVSDSMIADIICGMDYVFVHRDAIKLLEPLTDDERSEVINIVIEYLLHNQIIEPSSRIVEMAIDYFLRWHYKALTKTIDKIIRNRQLAQPKKKWQQGKGEKYNG